MHLQPCRADDSNPEDGGSKGTSFFKKLQDAINSNDPHSATTDDKVAAIHENAEKFDDRTEGVFRYLQARCWALLSLAVFLLSVTVFPFQLSVLSC